MTAPGILKSWDYNISCEELLQRADHIVNECSVIYDKIGALKEHEVNFDSVLGGLAEAQRLFANENAYLKMPMHVSTHKELRSASSEASLKLKEFQVEIGMRVDIFEKLQLLEKMDTSVLSDELKQFLKRMVKSYERNGLCLDFEVQKQVKALKNEIDDMSVQFVKSLNEDNTVLEFTEEELKGLPQDFINSLEMVELGKRKVTLKPPHVLAIMRMAVNPETRRKLNFAYQTRCVSENLPRLKKAISLRHKKAQLLQYKNHADFVTEVLMAKNSDHVNRFLKELAEKLQPLWQKERKRLLQLKEEQCKLQGIPYDGQLNVWDIAFYKNLVQERDYNVDQEKLRAYFPLDVVQEGLFRIYESLLGLKFEKIKDIKLWHPEAQAFSVTDLASQELLGYFVLDLFPREGKYSHFCNRIMQPTCHLPDGSRQPAVVAVLCNFPKPTVDTASLLPHSNVKTFFHEFGHTMHHICSRPSLAMFDSLSVERDFLECPSQMLENWIWHPDTLQLMSGHYSTGEPLPQEMGQALAASRVANVGQFNLQRVHLSLFDLMLHSQPEPDIRKVFRDLQLSLLGYPPQEGTDMAASFGHLMNGYDGQYYGYLWSEVYSMDLFNARFKKEGIMNPKTGKDYRYTILRPGASQDATVMLKNFLGREPTMDAFLISKGLLPACTT